MHGLITGRIEIVAVADVIAVLRDDVDDPRLHRGHRHLGAVDGQRQGHVGRHGETAGERERQQRNEDQRSQMRRARLMKFVLCIQISANPRLGPRSGSVPPT